MRKLTRIICLMALGQCLAFNIALAQTPAEPSAVAGEKKISIEQCYDLARTNYPLLQKYDLIDLSESFNLKMAAHAYIPQIGINGRASYQNETLEFPFKIPSILGETPVFSKDQYQLALEVTQLIWDGGITTSKRKSTRAEAQSSREQLEVDLYALKGRINDIYFGILLLQEQLALNDIMVEQLNDNAVRVRTCIENGVASQSDYDMIDVEMIASNQRKIQMKTMQQAYEEMLSIMIGQKVTAESLIKPVIADRTPKQVVAELSLANVLRPELKLMDARMHEVDVKESMLYTYVMPRLGLFVRGMYGRPGLNMLSNDFALNTIAGVSLTWNFGALYDLYSGRSLLRNSKREIEVMKETFLFNMELQSRSQTAESEKYIRLMEDDDKIINLRSRIRKSVEAAMEIGSKNAADLIQELGKEQVARQQKAVHEMELLKSIYELKEIKNQ